MSSYYFPQGGGATLSITNISHSILATTASVPIDSSLSVLTASYAPTALNTPASGPNGTNQTAEACGLSTISGSTGVQGPTGSKGTDNVTCPAGTIECTALNVSLSMALPGFPNGINFARPSGSKFSKVCMQIPPGCTSETAVCPDYLPTSSITTSYPSIP